MALETLLSGARLLEAGIMMTKNNATRAKPPTAAADHQAKRVRSIHRPRRLSYRCGSLTPSASSGLPADFLTASLSRLSKEDGEDPPSLGSSGSASLERVIRNLVPSRKERGA